MVLIAVNHVDNDPFFLKQKQKRISISCTRHGNIKVEVVISLEWTAYLNLHLEAFSPTFW